MASEISPSSKTPFKIERQTQPVVIRRHDAVIASTTSALLVTGETATPIYYVPRSDVYMEQLTESGDHSGEPRRAGRHYWSVVASGGGVEDAAWMIASPSGEEAALADHIGFDPDVFNITTG